MTRQCMTAISSTVILKLKDAYFPLYKLVPRVFTEFGCTVFYLRFLLVNKIQIRVLFCKHILAD